MNIIGVNCIPLLLYNVYLYSMNIIGVNCIHSILYNVYYTLNIV